MTIRRLNDWPERLHDYVAATFNREFSFGSQDCASWALGAIDAMCGSGIRSEFLPGYSTEAEAEAVLSARGWPTLREAAQDVLGVHEINPYRAQRGDLIWVPRLPDIHGRGPGGGLGILDVNKFLCPGSTRIASFPFLPIVKRGAVVFPVGRVA